jgi:hypothetical protein
MHRFLIQLREPLRTRCPWQQPERQPEQGLSPRLTTIANRCPRTMMRPLNHRRLLQGLLLQGLLLPALVLPAPAEPAPAPAAGSSGAAPQNAPQPAAPTTQSPTQTQQTQTTPQPTPQAGNASASPAGQPQGDSELSPKEKALLQQIRSLKAPRWRRFGACRYDWTGWRLAPEGVRTTSAECGEPAKADTVAVHCATLKVSRRVGQEAWSPWRLPLSTEESSSSGGEDLMVAALCANAQPIPESKAQPKPDAKAVTATPTSNGGKPQPSGKAQPEAKPQPSSKPATGSSTPAPAKR